VTRYAVRKTHGKSEERGRRKRGITGGGGNENVEDGVEFIGQERRGRGKREPRLVF